jgi:integrase/recombinase XerD
MASIAKKIEAADFQTNNFTMDTQAIIDEVTKIFRKNHIDYNQSKHIIKEVRRNLRLKDRSKRRGTVKRLSREDLQKFINQANEESAVVGLMMQTLYDGAFRVSEFVELRPEDLMVDERKIIVRSGKGGKRREIPITVSLMNSLRLYLDGRDVGYLFENSNAKKFSSRRIQQIVKRLGKEAGIVMDVTPHTLRHTRATVLAEDGMPKDLLQGFLGHESPNTTQIYTDTAQLNFSKHFRNKYDKLP